MSALYIFFKKADAMYSNWFQQETTQDFLIHHMADKYLEMRKRLIKCRYEFFIEFSASWIPTVPPVVPYVVPVVNWISIGSIHNPIVFLVMFRNAGCWKPTKYCWKRYLPTLLLTISFSLLHPFVEAEQTIITTTASAAATTTTATGGTTAIGLHNPWQGRFLFSWLWDEDWKRRRRDIVINTKHNRNQHGIEIIDPIMGNTLQQGMRIVSYDRAANERAALPVLNFAGQTLAWFRLDDGVMGGQSETLHRLVRSGGGGDGDHSIDGNDASLHFQGTINTEGGGFTSIRARIPPGTLSNTTTALRIRYKGDGKTYKILLSEGNKVAGGPFSRLPSWQMDLPTKNRTSTHEMDWEEAILPLDQFQPSWGGRRDSRPSKEEQVQAKFNPTTVQEIGIMLSLYLANGEPNPKETYGEGIFPFSLQVQSLEPQVQKSS